MKKFLCFAMFAFLLTAACSAFASETSNRMKKTVGIYLGILGDPAPTVLGVNGAYNLTDYLRLTAGFGRVKATVVSGGLSSDVSMTTVGGGAKFLLPGWNFTPVISLNYSHVFLNATGLVQDVGADNIFVGYGFDWQTELGFNLGVGLNTAISGASGTLPYINLGWYF